MVTVSLNAVDVLDFEAYMAKCAVYWFRMREVEVSPELADKLVSVANAATEELLNNEEQDDDDGLDDLFRKSV